MNKNSTHIGIIRVFLVLFIAGSIALAQEPTVTRYSFENTSGGLGSNRNYAMAIQPGTNGGTIWFGGRNYDTDALDRTYVGGLSRVVHDVWGNPTWMHFTSSNSSLPDDWIYDLEFDHDGNLWIATVAGGAAKIDAANLGDNPGTTGWTIYAPSNSNMGYIRIYEIAIAPDGTIWFGHGAGDQDADAALTIYDGVDQWQVVSMSNTPLTQNRVYGIDYTPDGHAWLGLKGGDVFEFNYGNTPFDTGDDTYTKHTLTWDLINAGAVAAHPSGDVYFGHPAYEGDDDGGGVSRYNASEGTIVRYEIENVTDVGARIRAVIVDSYGVVWLGSKGGRDYGSSGVWRFDPRVDEEPLNVFRQTGEDPARNNDDNWINQMGIDEENQVIWLASDFYGTDPDISGVVKIEGLWEPTDTTSTSVADNVTELPIDFSLAQNYPNPFNPETYIEYALNTAQYINLSIYDIQGRLVRLLDQGNKAPGTYRIFWNGQDSNGDDVHSGVYLYVLESDRGSRETRKAILLR
jgi:hypothetical protein